MLELDVAGQRLRLLVGRAVHWPVRDTLLIADPHFGKVDTFARNGIPMPEAAAAHDVDRLAKLLQATAAARLVVLGDFIHARLHESDVAWRRLLDFRKRFSALTITVVRGNHDRHADALAAALRAELVDEPRLDPPFVYRHHPADKPAGYVLAGHVHPVVHVRTPARGRLRKPCFHFTETAGLLPAFARFTGGHNIKPTAADRVIAVDDQALVPLRPPGAAGRPTTRSAAPVPDTKPDTG